MPHRCLWKISTTLDPIQHPIKFTPAVVKRRGIFVIWCVCAGRSPFSPAAKTTLCSNLLHRVRFCSAKAGLRPAHTSPFQKNKIFSKKLLTNVIQRGILYISDIHIRNNVHICSKKIMILAEVIATPLPQRKIK